MQRYAAFISYSSKDAGFAKRLHRALERYVIPGELGAYVFSASGPKNRVYPVFRDRDELAAGDLTDGIHAALAESENLIVICSQSAAQSQWVNKEIARFKALRRTDRIFAIIAPSADDGASQDLQSIFPPELIETEHAGGGAADRDPVPIAADARKDKDGFRPAVLKIVAGIAGLTLGDLIDRDRRRQTRQRLALGALASAVVVAAVTTWIGFFQPIVTYAEGYERRFGVWTEARAISKATAEQREASYEFHRKGLLNPPHRVRFVNGSGTCPLSGYSNMIGKAISDQCSAARACSFEFSYTRAGQLTEEVTKDHRGNVLETMSYANPTVGQFTEGGFGCSRSFSGIKYVRIERFMDGARRGLDRKLEFLSDDRTPRVNETGAFGTYLERSARGEITAEWFVGPAGEHPYAVKGFAGTTFTYAPDGRIQRASRVDPSGRPTAGPDGVATTTYTHDQVGNTIQVAFLDEKDAPTIDTTTGAAGYGTTFSKRGEPIGTAYVDRAGRPAPILSGYAFVERRFNADGYLTEERYLSAERTPALSDGKFHISRVTRGPYGEALASAYVGESGEPVTVTASGESGYHGAQSSFDARGNRIAQVYLGTDGRPTLNDPQRIAGWLKSYDARNREVQSITLGLDGRPMAGADGVTITRYRYDEHDNVVEERWFDAQGKPISKSDEPLVFAELDDYDDLGRPVRSTNVGADGRPIDTESGWAIRRYSVTSGRTVTGFAQFNAKGEPVVDANGVHLMRIDVDAAGRETSRSYFGLDNQPVLNASGYHRFATTRDVFGNEIAYAFLDLEGRETLAQDIGASRIVMRRDRMGREIERRFFGPDGKHAVSPERATGWKSMLDGRGNEIERVYLDAADRPARVSAGWARTRMTYDARDNVVTTSYFDADGRPTPDLSEDRSARAVTSITAYDRLGNPTETRNLAADGKLAQSHATAAIIRVSYDSAGRVVERRFFDEKGQLANHPDSGRAIVRFKRNASGRIVEIRSFDAREKPVDAKPFGWHVRQTTYAADGRSTAVCRTASGSPVKC